MKKNTKKTKIVDGEINSLDTRMPKYKNLAEVMGENVSDASNISEFSRYSEKINAMNISDLERECLRVHVLPRESRGKMIEILERSWKKNNSKYKDMRHYSQPKLSDQQLKELKDILSAAK